MYIKQQGSASLLAAALIIGAFAIGFAAVHISGKKDSALEQSAEAVLKGHDIDYDFSADEKNNDDSQ